MDLVRMQHPTGLTAEVPESALGQHAMAGWKVDESQTPPPCPACGRPWPTEPPQDAEQQDQTPAESGVSSSEPPRRRKTRTESDL